MAESCIVCLGDLAITPPDPAEPPPLPPASPSRATGLSTAAVPNGGRGGGNDDPNTIAHILPCGHNLHNECLKPWVERANSCPICRQSFNMVELCSHINGPCLSSYAVQEKKQVADVDTFMIVEEEIVEEPDLGACLRCEEYGNDDLLLLCDGCEAACHTYCAGLGYAVPAGAWYCHYCEEDPATMTISRVSARGRQRTRGQRQQGRLQREHSPSEWTRVWQSVFNRTHLDLDFPFDDDPGDNEESEAQRREYVEWQERFRIAQRQGGAARFRDTAAAILEARNGRGRNATPPPAESQEELRAWNAFDKSKELRVETDTQNGRRKRKSVTASPAEPQAPEPPRKLKRPRTRRVNGATDAALEPTAESSLAATRRSSASAVSTPTAHSRPTVPNTHAEGPSFLQSLLNEVETAPPSANMRPRNSSHLHLSVPTNHELSSPTLHSPLSSPVSSNAPSMRARSLSPCSAASSRPSSPPPLTSNIEPIFAQPEQYSPTSPQSRPVSPKRDDRIASHSQSAYQGSLRGRKKLQSLKIPPKTTERQMTNESSPSRAGMSLQDKNEIQKLVKAALKPAWVRQEISFDQYTNINREVSRQLYERIGKAGTLVEGSVKKKWAEIAEEQVAEALKELD